MTPPALPAIPPKSLILEYKISEVLVVLARARHFIARAFLLHVAGFMREIGNRCEEFLEVERPLSELRIARAIGNDVLQVEGVIAIPIARQVLHRVTATHQHVADIELKANN